MRLEDSRQNDHLCPQSRTPPLTRNTARNSRSRSRVDQMWQEAPARAARQRGNLHARRPRAMNRMGRGQPRRAVAPTFRRRRIPQATEDFRRKDTTNAKRSNEKRAGGPAARQWGILYSSDAPLPTPAEKRRGSPLNAKGGLKKQQKRGENGRKSPYSPCALYDHTGYGSRRARRRMRAQFGGAGSLGATEGGFHAKLHRCDPFLGRVSAGRKSSDWPPA